MTSTEKRLDAMGSALTLRERLTLVTRAWLNGEEFDKRLMRHVPPEDKPEFDRLLKVVEETNSGLHHIMCFEVEWLRQLESVVSRFQLVEVLLAEQVGTAALPFPDQLLGFARDLPMLWGGFKTPEEAPPASWDELRLRLREDIRLGFELRCQGLLSVEKVLHDLDEAFGEPMSYRPLLESFPPCWAKLAELASIMRQFAEELVVPSAVSDEMLAIARAHVPVDDFPTASPAQARYLPWQERESVEAFEAEQAALLRNR